MFDSLVLYASLDSMCLLFLRQPWLLALPSIIIYRLFHELVE